MTRLVALGAIGCAGTSTTGPSDPTNGGGPRTQALLVDMAAWVAGDAAVAADPLPDHRPDGAECPAAGALLEGGAFEVRSGTCTYGWFQQPAKVDLVPGDPVEIVWWHDALVSEIPAQGHVALFVGDALLYERYVDIPGDPAAYTDVAFAGPETPAGTIVTLHVHNHGSNDYNLLRVERQGAE